MNKYTPKCFKFDLSLTKNSIYNYKTNVDAHVKRQTEFVEFDLSLAQIQFSIKKRNEQMQTQLF